MAGMRRKTIVSRARIRVSPQPSDSDDVNGGSGFEGDEGTRDQSPKAHDKGNSGGGGLREKSPILGDNEAGSSIDQLKSNACIVCDGEDNQVLVCHETECPVSIHRSCMPDEPDFDEFGNFFCAYCWYKRLVVKSLKLQEKLMAAEKLLKVRDVSVGVDMAVTVDENGGNLTNVIEVNNEDGESSHQRVELETNQHNKTVAAETHEMEVSENDERAQRHDSDVGGRRKRRRKSSDQEEMYEDESHSHDDEERECGSDLREDVEIEKEQENGLKEDEKSKLDVAPSISSPISPNSDNESDIPDQEFAFVMRPRRNIQEQLDEAWSCDHNATSLKRPLFEPEKFSRGKRYEAETANDYHVPKRRKDEKKRKRQLWTHEEEEMLRVAVEKFSKTTNKHMPWRKVLEFGRNMFQKGRTPTDLKDKWKKMNKMS